MQIGPPYIDSAHLAGALAAIAAETDPHAGDGRRRIIGHLKAQLGVAEAAIRQNFEAGASGLETAAARAQLIDELLVVIYRFATETLYPATNLTAGERLAVLATGGYGRRELAPLSDVDVQFLFTYKQTAWGEQVVEYILYLLWDLGLKVGHATRSIEDSIRFAKADTTIATALLEARFIAGDRTLFRSFQRRYAREIVDGVGLAFVEAKLAERDERHRQMGDSRYVVEPNIKEGKGGLRDLQTLFWIGKYLYKADRTAELVNRGVLTAREHHRFVKASNFLWTVRCHLHYLTGRPEERLTFDVQPEIGQRLGYRDQKGARAVERFMKHYYLVAKNVGDLTRIFCNALEDQHKRTPLLRRLGFGRREVDGFVVQSGRLQVANEEAFADDPVRLIRLFHVADKRELDIHPAVLKLITRNLWRINRKLRANKEANRLFLEILTSRQDPEKTLRRMNEAGVLGRFVPDFGRVVAQMQYDMYHVYTVDEHAIRAIGVLAEIEKGTLAEEHPVANVIIHKVKSRRALYLGLFCHDIAKGRGGDHSEIGAEVARKLSLRLGLTAEEAETASWLVRNHLVMSHYAFKRDTADPKTVQDFGALVQSPERLRLLAVLTVADIRAVGPGRWNGWKGQLLRELHAVTEDALSGGAGEGRGGRVAAMQAALRARLADWPDETLSDYFARHSDSYWLANDIETLVRHARIVRKSDRRKSPFAFETRTDAFRAITEVTLYAPDQPGLFARLAGAMAVVGVSVLDARIATTADGMALDTLWIQERDGKPVAAAERLERLSRTVAQCLAGEMDIGKALARRPAVPSRTQVFTVQPRVIVDNQASHLYTVIEVNARDRARLLYDLTVTLSTLGFSIASAHIQTFGERAVDVFYLKDKFGLKIAHPRLLETVDARLREALARDVVEPPKDGKPAIKAPSRPRAVAPAKAEDAVRAAARAV